MCVFSMYHYVSVANDAVECNTIQSVILSSLDVAMISASLANRAGRRVTVPGTRFGFTLRRPTKHGRSTSSAQESNNPTPVPST